LLLATIVTHDRHICSPSLAITATVTDDNSGADRKTIDFGNQMAIALAKLTQIKYQFHTYYGRMKHEN
jgi:hypothetical protein